MASAIARIGGRLFINSNPPGSIILPNQSGGAGVFRLGKNARPKPFC